MKYAISLLLFCLFTVSAAFATPVGPMNYQGRLLDNQGIPVTGSYNFVVKIYNAPTNGVLKYQEQHDAVPVDDGVYSFKVGTGTSQGGDSEWDINLWQLNLNNLYMEIMVNGETLTPRHELTSAPHAFTATLALAAESLGGKTAAEYENILEGVCVAGQGKWFNKVSRCLGRGAVFNQPVALSDLMDPVSTDFSNLDLTDADISGITLSNVDFSNTTLKNTVINAGAMTNINLTGATIEGLTSTSPLTNTPINFTDASIKGVNMQYWDLSSATLAGSSSMNLSKCPAALPVDWSCNDQSGGYKLKLLWTLLGPYVNLSKTSLVAGDLAKRDDEAEIKKSVFSGINLQHANFEGVKLNGVVFSAADLSNANFNNTTIQNVLFYSNMSNVSMYNADIMETRFSAENLSAGVQATRFSNVQIAFTASGAYFDVVGSRLENVQFTYGTGLQIVADNTTYFDNVAFMVPLGSLYLENAVIYRGIYFAPGTEGLSFVDPQFYGGNITGDFTSANFSGGTFVNVSFAGVDLTGATGLDSAYVTFQNVSWANAICPDGYLVRYAYQTCTGHLTPL